MDESALPPFFRLYAEGSIATKAEVKRRFMNCLADTWRGLPAEDVAMITGELERIGGAAIEIQLRDRHHNLKRGPSGDATAQFNRLGPEIIFKSLFAERLSDAACRYWIAHEFGHLFLNMTNAAHGTSYDAAEEEVASLLVDRWGFRKDDEENLEAEVFLIRQDVPAR